jgi:hypothetical protein
VLLVSVGLRHGVRPGQVHLASGRV